MSRSTGAPSTVHTATAARRPGRLTMIAGSLAALVSGTLLIGFAAAGSAAAADPQVDLATSGAYSVLGGQTVTNTGPSRLNKDLGVDPGTAITGFPPGKSDGATHAADAVAIQAQSDLTTAYNHVAGLAKTSSVDGDLVGRTLTSGVYNSTGPLALSGTVTLDAQGNPDAVFVFQVTSTLITASASYVNVINGAQACNVYWQVGSSATLGTASVFRGSILALTSISVTTGVTVQGRALARNGAVTLDDDTFTSPECGTPVEATPSSTTVSVAPTTTTTGTTVTGSATVTGATAPTGSVVFTSDGTTLGSAPVDGSGHATLPLPAGTHAGDRTITATYGGSPVLLPSTSRATLSVRAPVARTTAPAPVTTAPSAAASPTARAPLANTGTAPLDVQITGAAALIALGAVALCAGNRRRPARHRR